jgi:beta-glucosidase
VAREDGAGEATLEVRAGERLLTEIAVPVTGHRHTWTTVSAATPERYDGVHDLRITLRGAFRLASFRLDPPGDGPGGELPARQGEGAAG